MHNDIAMLRGPASLAVLLATHTACVADTEFLDYDDLVPITVRVEPEGDLKLLASGADGGPFALTDVRGPTTVVIDVPRGGSVSSRMDDLEDIALDIVWSFAGLEEGEEITFVDFTAEPELPVGFQPSAPPRRLFADLGCAGAEFSSDAGLDVRLACHADPFRVGLFELDDDGERIGVATLTVPRSDMATMRIPEPADFEDVLVPHSVVVANAPNPGQTVVEVEGIIGRQRFGYFTGPSAVLVDGETEHTFELFPFDYEAYEVRVTALGTGLEIRERTTGPNRVVDFESSMPIAEGEASLDGASWRAVGEDADVDHAVLTYVTAEVVAPNEAFEAVTWYVALPVAAEGRWNRPVLPSAVAAWGQPDERLRDVSVHHLGSTRLPRSRSFEILAAMGVEDLGRLEWRQSHLHAD